MSPSPVPKGKLKHPPLRERGQPQGIARTGPSGRYLWFRRDLGYRAASPEGKSRGEVGLTGSTPPSFVHSLCSMTSSWGLQGLC